MTTKKSEKGELTQEELIQNQINYLENELSKASNTVETAKASFNQVLGALNFAKAQLNDIKSKK